MRTLSAIFRQLAAISFLLLAGCPIDVFDPCYYADPPGSRVNFDRLAGGDQSQILFDRTSYDCSQAKGPFDLSVPAQVTLMRLHLPDLAVTEVDPPLPLNSLVQASDGHWVVFAQLGDDSLHFRDVDTGEEHTLPADIPPLIDSFAWPYVLTNSIPLNLVNVQTGEIRQIGDDGLTYGVLTEHFLAFVVRDGNGDIHLLDLDTGEERVAVAGEPAIWSLYAAPGHIVWTDSSNSIHVYDVAADLSSDTGQIGTSSYDSHAPFINDVGVPGILLTKSHNQFLAEPSATLELIDYQGQLHQIDDFAPATYNAHFAGSFVVYYNGANWMIYNTADGAKSPIEPFAAATSNP